MLSSIKNTLAKIPKKDYWTSLTLSLIGLMSTYGAAPQWSLLDYIEVAIAVISLYGVYLYTNNKRTVTLLKYRLSDHISFQFWRWFFWIRVISWFAYIKYLFTPKAELIKLPLLLNTTVITAPQDAALILFTTLPTIYALSILRRKKSKKDV